MKQFALASTFFLHALIFTNNAQNLQTKQASWQQRIDHNIRVQLDTATKTLHCNETIRYTNNSPDALTAIPIHIWPNAFSSKRSAYGKEALINGNNAFLQAKKEQMGFLDSLSFEVNGKKASYTELETDIILLHLPEPLQPGLAITIYTPFRVKLPALFSRMGFVGDLLSVTQWYPKPAVYDANGWNTFSYVDQGEYFSDFGAYEVAITVPENYVVAATGELQEEKELEWLSELAEGSAVKRSNSRTKTLHYKQENVSDFAWFADPGFAVGEGEVKLENGRKVHTYVFRAKGDKTGISGVKEAVEKALTYYSSRVGNYPYKYCSVVIGELKSAGGMEYPMITICGSADKGTVIHEVGHNWFQGMLGSQERNHPWMDESINTFYQVQAEGAAPKEWEDGERLKVTGLVAAFHGSWDLGVFQEGNLHSEAYQQINYGAIVYQANPLRFMYLQEFLGKPMMDSCMHRYFDLWQYKHPLPADMQGVFEQVSGKDLNWFFAGLMGSSAPDVAVRSVKRTDGGIAVRVNNKGKYELPVKLEWKNGNSRNFIWFQASDTTIRLPLAESVRLNPTGFLAESNIANNGARTRGVLKTFGKLKFGFPDLYKRGINKVWMLPNVFSANRYDGFMPGIMLSNFTIPRRNWEWWLIPSYGVKSESLVGIAGLQRNIWFKKGIFTLLELKVVGRSFHFRPDSARTLQRYGHLEPQLLLLMKRKKAWVQNAITADFSVNRFDNALRGKDIQDPKLGIPQNNILRIGWTRHRYKKASPGRLDIHLENGYQKLHRPFSGLELGPGNFAFIKANADATRFFSYNFFRTKGAGFSIRTFASVFITNRSSPEYFNPVISGANGTNDYAFRQLLVNRSENMYSGTIWSQQLLSGAMGVRMLPNITANGFVAGVNLESAFIPKVPLQLFFDAVHAGDQGERPYWYWAGGINYRQRTGSTTTFEINLPLLYSSNFNSLMQGLKWYEGVTFKINLSILQPLQFARSVYQ